MSNLADGRGSLGGVGVCMLLSTGGWMQAAGRRRLRLDLRATNCGPHGAAAALVGGCGSRGGPSDALEVLLDFNGLTGARFWWPLRLGHLPGRPAPRSVAIGVRYHEIDGIAAPRSAWQALSSGGSGPGTLSLDLSHGCGAVALADVLGAVPSSVHTLSIAAVAVGGLCVVLPPEGLPRRLVQLTLDVGGSGAFGDALCHAVAVAAPPTLRELTLGLAETDLTDAAFGALCDLLPRLCRLDVRAGRNPGVRGSGVATLADALRGRAPLLTDFALDLSYGAPALGESGAASDDDYAIAVSSNLREHGLRYPGFSCDPSGNNSCLCRSDLGDAKTP